MSWYFEPWKKFASFGGRARRREYWTFTVVNWLIWMILYFVLMFGMGFSFDASDGAWSIGPILIFLFYLLTAIPTFAVTVRRLHDTGRSGWWFLINFLPFIGSLILLFFLISDSQQGPNRWGANPKMPGNTQWGYNPNPQQNTYYPPQQQAPAPPSQYCRNCGAGQTGPGAFCQNCGAKR